REPPPRTPRSAGLAPTLSGREGLDPAPCIEAGGPHRGPPALVCDSLSEIDVDVRLGLGVHVLSLAGGADVGPGSSGDREEHVARAVRVEALRRDAPVLELQHLRAD